MLLIVFLCGLAQAYAQDRTITGKIVDETGTTLPGATVLLKGTTKVTVTDVDGNYKITVPSTGGILVVTYVGYISQEKGISTSDVIDFNLAPEVKSLDQIIVVGYGVQKKSLVTGAISKIDSKDITAAPVQRIDQALQGKTSGVFIAQSSGSPGSSMSIKIRGNSSNFNNSPLYIVDGIKTSSIDYLSPSDIESTEVLKDAASCAIYGTEGGNGVIIITTKKGTKGTSEINYTYNHGWQVVGHTAKVMSSQEYLEYLKEAYEYEHLRNAKDSAANMNHYQNFTSDWATNSEQPISNTNWQDQIFQTAPVDEHHISFSSGNDKGTFMLSASYLNQDGIVGGPKSNYTRYTFLFNGEQKMKDWLSVGSNVAYTKSKRNILNESNEFGGIVTNAIFFDPTAPVHYGTDTLSLPLFARGNPQIINSLIKNDNGEYYGLSPNTAGEAANPLAQIQNTHAYETIDKILGDVHADINFAKGLKFTSRLSMDYSLVYDDIFRPLYYYNGQNQSTNDTGATIQNRYVKNYKYGFENFLTIDKTFGDHSFVAVLGMSYDNYSPQYIDGTGNLVPENSAQYAYLYNTNNLPGWPYSLTGGLGTGVDPFSNASNPPNGQEVGNIQQSYFGRVNYNYKERYLIEGTLRRDGSSLFGPNNHFGMFPSFSLGWNLSNEDFFKDALSKVSSAKLRFSWGENGSDQALLQQPFAYSSVMVGGANYTDRDGVNQPGNVPQNPGNASLKWETSKQIDGGLDLAVLNNKLTLTVDYFNKKTMDQLVQNAKVPYYLGYYSIPWANQGEVQNKGWEFNIGYKQMEGAFKYSVTFNATYLQNKVISFGDSGLSTSGAKAGVGDFITHYTAGQPAWFFFGYDAVGIFQTQQEVDDYNVCAIGKNVLKDNNGKVIINPTDDQIAAAQTANPGVTVKRQLIQPKAVPGDIKYADVNGDGQITNKDEGNIGDPWPAWTYGLNLYCEYKGFDMTVFFQGVQGNKIFYVITRNDHPEYNKPEYYYTQRWHGEGTSNTMPRATIDESTIGGTNYYYSNFDVFSGNYIRLKNITLGYTLPVNLTKKIGISKFRVYFTGINLLTFTKYPGADPEVGQDVNSTTSNNQSYGVDRGMYPSSKSYNVGVNVTF